MILSCSRVSLCGVVANVLAFSLEVSKFEVKLRYYVHIQTNTFGKDMNPFITHPRACYGFNNITTVILQEMVTYEIKYEGWYAIE